MDEKFASKTSLKNVGVQTDMGINDNIADKVYFKMNLFKLVLL